MHASSISSRNGPLSIERRQAFRSNRVGGVPPIIVAVPRMPVINSSCGRMSLRRTDGAPFGMILLVCGATPVGRRTRDVPPGPPRRGAGGLLPGWATAPVGRGIRGGVFTDHCRWSRLRMAGSWHGPPRHPRVGNPATRRYGRCFWQHREPRRGWRKLGVARLDENHLTRAVGETGWQSARR